MGHSAARRGGHGYTLCSSDRSVGEVPRHLHTFVLAGPPGSQLECRDGSGRAEENGGGDLLDWQVLRLPDDDQLLLVMTAPPDTGSLEVLHRLGSPNAT